MEIDMVDNQYIDIDNSGGGGNDASGGENMRNI